MESDELDLRFVSFDELFEILTDLGGLFLRNLFAKRLDSLVAFADFQGQALRAEGLTRARGALCISRTNVHI